MYVSNRYHRLALATTLAVAGASSLGAQLAGMAAIRGNVPITVGPFELNTRGSVDQIAWSARPRTALSLETDLRAPVGNGGLWIGSALEGASGIDTIPVRPLLRFGVWQSFGNAIQVSVGASSHAARVGGHVSVYTSPPDTGGHSVTARTLDSTSKLALWSEVESRLSWRVSRATVAAVVGARPNVDHYRPSLWGHLEAVFPLNAYASIVGAAGTDAPRIALGIPAVRFASAALRLGAWPSSKRSTETALAAFVVRSIGERRYTITYQSPDASSVELSGDFDGWRPSTLTQVRSGVWEATIVAAPGTYHVNLRVNAGKWFPPPGLPQTADDFNGAVGILVLR